MHALVVIPPDEWMAVNIVATLRTHYCTMVDVFHYPEVSELGSAEWRARRDRLNEELLVRARALKAAGRLDWIFCIVYDDFLRVETAEALRQLNVPMVNYHIDMAFQWYRAIRTAAYFDVIAVAQTTYAEQLARYNPNIEWMPMAAIPEFYAARAAEARGYQHAISFVGSFNPYRRALLAECVRSGLNPVVYGRGWLEKDRMNGRRFYWDPYKILHDLRHYAVPRWRAEGVGSLTGPLLRKVTRKLPFDPIAGLDARPHCETDTLPAIFRTSMVNLGFSDTGWHGSSKVLASRQLQCRLRDFEVPMSGGFYLVQEAPHHRECYRVGEEIETWTTPEELLDKARFYAQHPALAERIRSAGQKRALETHTWRHRFDRLLERLRKLGLLRSGAAGG